MGQEQTISIQKNPAARDPAASVHKSLAQSQSRLVSSETEQSAEAGESDWRPVHMPNYDGARILPGDSHSHLNQNASTKTTTAGFRGIQTRLSINLPGDRFEQEADNVARAVMNAPEPFTGVGNVARLKPLRFPVIQQFSGARRRGGREAPASVLQALAQSGRPLDTSVRRYMEPRFGRSFEQVKIHPDLEAASSARDIGAQAYTVGNHVVFGKGNYAPHLSSGRELIAHELTHVIQQQGWSGSHQGINLSLQRRNIFQEIGGLFAGDTFDASTLQTYLNFIDSEDRIENFTDSDNKARAIVAQWKTGSSSYNLTGRLKRLLIQEMLSGFTGDDDENAILELLWRSSNSELSTIFSGISATELNSNMHGSQWDQLQTFYSTRFEGGMSEVLAGRIVPQGRAFRFGDEVVGLRTPTSAESAQVREAISTEARTSTGAVPQFQQNISGEDPWEIRVRDKVNDLIDSLYQSRVASRPARVPANMLADTDINRVAREAQRQTDSVYGGYYGPRPPYEVGVNIFDAYDFRDAQINASESNADRAANFRVLKLLNGDDQIKAINNEHGAIHTRQDEWALIAPLMGFPLSPVLTEALNTTNPPHVTTGVVGARRDELLDIHRNWSAYAGSGTIYLDRMEAPTDHENRNRMYRIFRTVMHEYVHTLEHPDHVAYRQSLGAQQGGFVLREGVTEFLSKRVWDQVNFTPALRTLIEGSYQDPLNPNGHDYSWLENYGYDERVNAERMANVVGIDNVAAAFFLGRVELIGA